MLRRARKAGRKFLNPVPTTIGGFGTIFKVLPRFLSNKAEKFPRDAAGAVQDGCRGVCGRRRRAGCG